MGCWRNVWVAILLLAFVVAGETGPCRYEDSQCSCKLDLPGQGRCWDRIGSRPGFCRQRACLQGWTCACAGRTHLCVRVPQLTNVVASADKLKDEAECEATPIPQVSEPSLNLGTFVVAISRNGIAADQCTQFTWWHNGVLRGEWQQESKTLDTDAAIDAALTERAQHTLLELRPGDLIAFQFTQASYYCYMHFSGFEVNGLNITTDMLGVTTHYARQASENWYDPSVTLDSSNTAADESETDLTKFLPPRNRLIGDDLMISPRYDYWQPHDALSSDGATSNGMNVDHLIGDWHWRIRIPSDLIDPSSASF